MVSCVLLLKRVLIQSVCWLMQQLLNQSNVTRVPMQIRFQIGIAVAIAVLASFRRKLNLIARTGNNIPKCHKLGPAGVGRKWRKQLGM